MNYIKLYDQELYKESYITTLQSYNNISSEAILYTIKNIITIDSFKVSSISQLKKLLFFYFYKKWDIKFENGFIIYIDNKNYNISLNDISENKLLVSDYNNLINYWKNEIFLKWLKQTDNLIDHLLLYVKENSELYAFEWEHFPLFKWLINELVD